MNIRPVVIAFLAFLPVAERATTQQQEHERFNYNYNVLLDISNDDALKDLLVKADWLEVSERLDGPYILTYDLRNLGYWTGANEYRKTNLVNNFRNKRGIIECVYNSNFAPGG